MRLTVTGCLAVVAMTVMVVAAIPTAVHPNVKLEEPLETDEIINTVNNAKTTWVAGRNFKKSLTKRYLKNLMGVLMDFDSIDKDRPKYSTVRHNEEDDVDVDKIPAQFDAREHFDYCSVIKTIRDQGSCGSCWAVAVVSAFSDRLCIATKGKFNTNLSAANLLSCCCCCAVSCGQGCSGGYVERATGYMSNTGVVTGGEFHSKEGCQPYPLKPCEHHIPGSRPSCSSYNETTPSCSQECYNKQYKNFTYDEDLNKAKYSVVLYDASVQMIQKEILRSGPVVATFIVYEDFLSYKSGVYQHTAGDKVGGHAVRIIGWGVEDGISYWLVANSWNTDWGDNGIFKISQDNSSCFFGYTVAYVKPDTSKYKLN